MSFLSNSIHGTSNSFFVYSIDAKNHTDRLCRYANDAPKTETECNAVMKMKVFNNYPRLCLFALRAIKAGDEIRYDYGEDEKSLVWRKKVSLNFLLHRLENANLCVGLYHFIFMCFVVYFMKADI